MLCSSHKLLGTGKRFLSGICCLLCLWGQNVCADENKDETSGSPQAEKIQENGQTSSQLPVTEPTSKGAVVEQPPTAPKAPKIELFGTKEFRLDVLPGWVRVVERNLADPIFVENKKLLNFNPTTWMQFKSQAKAKQGLDLLRFVNKFWNQSRYILDIKNWGIDDYWATPAEFSKKSGDCEDYAIVKYFTLKELGFPQNRLRIVALTSSLHNNQGHAVLVVYLDNDAFVLDNLSDKVLSHSQIPHYNPQFSVNETGRWGHYRVKKAKK